MTPRLILDVYSHGVRISGYSRETFRHLAIFLERLALKEPRKLPRGGMVMELKKRFYGLTENRREAFIHRHHLPELRQYLKDLGLEQSFTENIIPVPEAADINVTVTPDKPLRGYQIPIVEDLTDPLPTRGVKLQTGKGKSAPLYTLVKIPGGWSTMGEMEVGTPITAWDGTTTHVTGIYPQGTTPVYRVTFWDGRCTDVSPEHLWQSFYVNTSSCRRWAVRDTLELKRLCEMPNPRVYVPLVLPEDGPDVNVTIPPYTLGVVLGDGGISHQSLNVTKYDDFVFEEVLREAPTGSEWKALNHKTRKLLSGTPMMRHPYIDALIEYELWGCHSWEKYIPEPYLHGSTEQRFNLLQGLMDTDGTVNKPEVGGAISFSTTSRRMAGQVQYLVRSLGGIASLSERNPTYTYKGEKKKGRVAYQVNIHHPEQRKLFRLPRKRDRVSETNQYSADLKLRVRSVEYLGEEPTQCISVAHPDHLYVTDDFIVTHNTLCALTAVAKLGKRTVVMVPPKYFGIWVEALRDVYVDFRDEQFCTVSGGAELRKVIEEGIAGTLEYDFILVSQVTYRTYIEAFERFGEKGLEEIGYGCPPPRFHEALRAGVQIDDEIQEDPGLVFRIDIFTNLKKKIYLSATPFTGNDYVTRMINTMLPAETDCRLPAYDAYINVIGLLYNDPGVKGKDYLTPFKNTYNHARYETRMLKAKKRLERYFGLVKRTVEGVYAKDREPGQKLLILCATVEFIRHLTKFLNMTYPSLRVGMHVSGSDYNKLLTNDITVSTIKSSGTGVDIPNLREVLLLQATDSKKDNIQILGRLRKLKDWPDLTPRLTYMVCQDIPKHVTYHRNKQGHFQGKIKGQKLLRL